MSNKPIRADREKAYELAMKPKVEEIAQALSTIRNEGLKLRQLLDILEGEPGDGDEVVIKDQVQALEVVRNFDAVLWDACELPLEENHD